MNSNNSVYEINTRVWFKRFGVKSILEIPDEYWLKLKYGGMDYVWLMGVWRISEASVEKYCFDEDLVRNYERALKDYKKEDVIGSPFAIDDYELNPSLGKKGDLALLKSKLNSLGLKLLLDFIPNHFNAESSLIEKTPDLFLPSSRELFENDSHTYFYNEKLDRYFAHGRDPFFPAWQDTIQINYFNPAARKYLTEKLIELTKLCDGVRCDMAMLMLNNVFKNTWTGVVSSFKMEIPSTEFWKETIAKVKAEREDFLFIAEVYWDLEWELQQQGFDYTYDKRLIERLRFGNVSGVRDHLRADKKFQNKSVRFLENHDETRAHAALGREREKAAAVVMSTIQGMRLYNDGQFEGKRIKLPVQLGREPLENPNEDLEKFYERLLKITAEDVFKKGEWMLLETDSSWDNNFTNNNLLAWMLKMNTDTRVVVVNYSDLLSSCRLKLDVRGYADEIVISDLLNEQSYVRSAEEIYHTGLFVELKPWQAHVFAF